MGKNAKPKNKKKTPNIQEHIRKKIHFSFEYFNYDGIQEKTNEKFIKKTLLKMKKISNYTILEALKNKLIILEKSTKTIEIAKNTIKNNEFFINSCNSNIYDLFRGDLALRVFGVVDSNKNCFHILMFDPTHDSR